MKNGHEVFFERQSWELLCYIFLSPAPRLSWDSPSFTLQFYPKAQFLIGNLLVKDRWSSTMVPHSQCSLRENRNFWKNLDLKLTHCKTILDFYFSLISAIVIPNRHTKVKIIILFYKNVRNCLESRKISRLKVKKWPNWITFLMPIGIVR
jgi:hypothetical protein